ncbi:MAG: integration host factor subunit alpha [Deltaproteobacteria bacterium]|nr:integration host factor subunit alpha [Deltaproteobacteria bacterium]
MSLTKINLVEKICDEVGMSKKEAMSVVDSLFEIMKDELSTGKPVMISGFGKWSVKSKRSRIGRNPQTGESITVAARNVLVFKLSNVMRNAVNSAD